MKQATCYTSVISHGRIKGGNMAWTFGDSGHIKVRDNNWIGTEAGGCYSRRKGKDLGMIQ